MKNKDGFSADDIFTQPTAYAYNDFIISGSSGFKPFLLRFSFTSVGIVNGVSVPITILIPKSFPKLNTSLKKSPARLKTLLLASIDSGIGR